MAPTMKRFERCPECGSTILGEAFPWHRNWHERYPQVKFDFGGVEFDNSVPEGFETPREELASYDELSEQVQMSQAVKNNLRLIHGNRFKR